MIVKLRLQKAGFMQLEDTKNYYVPGFGFVSFGATLPPVIGTGGLLLLNRGFQRGLRR